MRILLMMIPWFYVKLNLRWNEDDIFKIYFIPGIFSPLLIRVGSVNSTFSYRLLKLSLSFKYTHFEASLICSFVDSCLCLATYGQF